MQVVIKRALRTALFAGGLMVVGVGVAQATEVEPSAAVVITFGSGGLSADASVEALTEASTDASTETSTETSTDGATATVSLGAVAIPPAADATVDVTANATPAGSDRGSAAPVEAVVIGSPVVVAEVVAGQRVARVTVNEGQVNEGQAAVAASIETPETPEVLALATETVTVGGDAFARVGFVAVAVGAGGTGGKGSTLTADGSLVDASLVDASGAGGSQLRAFGTTGNDGQRASSPFMATAIAAPPTGGTSTSALTGRSTLAATGTSTLAAAPRSAALPVALASTGLAGGPVGLLGLMLLLGGAGLRVRGARRAIG